MSTLKLSYHKFITTRTHEHFIFESVKQFPGALKTLNCFSFLKIKFLCQQRIWIRLEFGLDNNAAELRRSRHAHVPERPAPTLTAIRKKNKL